MCKYIFKARGVSKFFRVSGLTADGKGGIYTRVPARRYTTAIANGIPFNPVRNSSSAQSEMRSNVGSLISSATLLLVHVPPSPMCGSRKMDKP